MVRADIEALTAAASAAAHEPELLQPTGAAEEAEVEPDAQGCGGDRGGSGGGGSGGDSGSDGSLAESLMAVEEGRRTARRGLDQVHKGAGSLRRTALHRKLLATEGWPHRYR